jgi:tRNA modification GTPase
MVNQIQEGFDITQETIITNARHVAELDASSASLKRALNALENGVSADFVAMDIRQAMFHLGSITGQISEDDLLANIFSKFCIGK